jgi:hypothetical protein
MTGRPRTRQRRHCATCGKELSKSARGTLCRTHYTNDADANARRAETIKRTFAFNPHLLAKRSRAIAEANRRPERRARSVQLAHERKLWELGLAAANKPQARARQGKTCSANRLAHIPEDMRQYYLSLTRRGIKAAEAEARTKALYEAQITEFRAKLLAAQKAAEERHAAHQDARGGTVLHSVDFAPASSS